MTRSDFIAVGVFFLLALLAAGVKVLAPRLMAMRHEKPRPKK